MTTEVDRFPAKLLLTGEFSVIHGGIALALPRQSLYGCWLTVPGQVDFRLSALYDTLKSLDFIDSRRFEQDVSQGLVFESSIPEGYGMGSSGALSAGILKKYGDSNTKDLDLIKKRLAEIEHYFHGTSSGFDPLISYLNRAVVFDQDQVQILPDGLWSENDVLDNFFLVDSLLARGTISPIAWYHKELTRPSFKKIISKLNTLNRDLTYSVLNKDTGLASESMKEISKIQFEHFRPLIADSLLAYWQKGLSEDLYYTKLCGKGNGGYYLVYTVAEINTLDIKAKLLSIK